MAISNVLQGGSINATDYNNLQSKVASILGTGSGDYGYGQTVVSSQVSATNFPSTIGDLVTATQMDNLKADIQKCWVHQTANTFSLGDINAGDEITAGTGTTTKTHNQYISYVNTIDTNRLPTVSLNASQMTTTQSVRADQRTADWNNFINYIFRVEFTNDNHRRHFFNTGGQIRISLSMSNIPANTDPRYLKSYNWQQILNNVGIVTFGFSQNQSTSTAYNIIYSSNSGDWNNTVYSENDVIVRVRANPSTNILEFEVRLQDDDTGDQTGIGPAQDEDVSGTITCSVDEFRATGSYVSISAPTYTNVSTF